MGLARLTALAAIALALLATLLALEAQPAGKVQDPVGIGTVASLAHPGGNITGIATLYDPNDPAMQLHQKCTEEAARALGIAVRPREARQRDEFEGVFAVLARERPDALITFTDAVIYANRERIIESTAKQRLPAMYEFKEFVVRGGLMAYGPSLSQLCECGATRVDKILKGAKPADLPVDLPTKFELVINLKTANALGLTILPAEAARADEAIQ